MSAVLDRLRSASEHPNVKAFLRMLRLGEGTADELGYRRIVGGGEFGSFAGHPKILVPIPRYRIKSTAAGAYQFIWPTWRSLVEQYGFPDFSPRSQDLGAIALIFEKGALDDVIAGRVERAIFKVRNIWASLPGSEHGQRTETLKRALAEYRKHGGQMEQAA